MLPAPTITLSPMLTLHNTIDLVPIKTLFPILTLPNLVPHPTLHGLASCVRIVTLDEIVTSSPISISHGFPASIPDHEYIFVFFPTFIPFDNRYSLCASSEPCLPNISPISFRISLFSIFYVILIYSISQIPNFNIFPNHISCSIHILIHSYNMQR